MQDYNIVVNNEHLIDNIDLLPILFNGQQTIQISPNYNMYDILVLCEIFKSKSQAKKN